MALKEFNIPRNVEDLLTGVNDYYYVKNVIITKEVPRVLKEAKQSLKEDGVEFILESFDVFFSILYQAESLQLSLIFEGYEVLQKAIQKLIDSLLFLLEDKESITDDVRTKYLTITKMLIYLYTQIVILIENMNISKSQSLLKMKKQRKPSVKEAVPYQLDKNIVINSLNNLLQMEINVFWDPPSIEAQIINITSEVFYQFLEDETIKTQKDLIIELFSFAGLLITKFNCDTTFILRIVQLIKMHEHLLNCVPDGIKHLVEAYNCKRFVHELIKEVTEWQTEENNQDSQGARNCSQLLTKLAIAMPRLMIPELMFLEKYLAYDCAPLRISVINVITEVILNVFGKVHLDVEQMQQLDKLLLSLKGHIRDISSSVRAKCIQNITKLQKDNILSIKVQNDFLEYIVPHLSDKSAIVRKNVMNCVTIFLSHNLYGPNLSLKEVENDLNENRYDLTKINLQLKGIDTQKWDEIESNWTNIEQKLKIVIEEEFNSQSDDDEEMEDIEENFDGKQLSDRIKEFLNAGEFKKTFQLCKFAFTRMEEWKDFQKRYDSTDGEIDMYLLMIRSMYCDLPEIVDKVKGNDVSNINLTEEDLNRIDTIKKRIDYLTDCVKFLNLIEKCIEPACTLLESATIGDMHEAVDFFVTITQFNIDNAFKGVLAMLKIMKRNEQERKDVVVEAFKKLYLTDIKDTRKHAQQVINHFMKLLKSIPLSNIDDLEAIIVEFVSKGTIKNHIIDLLWHYYMKQVPEASDEESILACELLRMAAIGRTTIVTKNLQLVAKIAFTERGQNSMRFLASSCAFLTVAGREKINIDSDSPPFKIKYNDCMFKNMSDILVEKFFEKDHYYSQALSNAIKFIYKLSNKPDTICEELIQRILKKLNELQTKKLIRTFVFIRTCQFFGFVAINHLEYMDHTVYMELKRRTNYHERRNKKQSKKSKRKSKINDLNETLNESTLEGAQAQDPDAEFVLDVLENHTITKNNCFGLATDFLLEICKHPNSYNDENIQNAAIIALIRFMLISSIFCKKHLQLLFTILDRSQFMEVKQSILLHLNDLLTRFPNLVEPWMQKIYDCLQHPSEDIRQATLFVLSNLILRDMVLAHSRISEMACCLVDKSESIVKLSKMFFENLSKKENRLYNVMPDIFSYLMTANQIDDNEKQYILKFLFEQISKSKHMENLVDRFCIKFHLTENIQEQRHVAFCLKLIQYNEKAFKKLHENFPNYKHLMRDGEIYSAFQDIFHACRKQQVGKVDLKPLVEELDKSIQELFEIKENEPAFVRPKVKTTKKKQVVAKRKRNMRSGSQTDDTLDEDVKERSLRPRKTNRKASVIEESSSDSD